MVHGSPRKTSPSRATRSSSRYKPTSGNRENSKETVKETSPTTSNQASCSTIFTINAPREQPPINGTLFNHGAQPLTSLHTTLVHGQHTVNKFGGTILGKVQNERLILDKVEDMDIDHQSDQEKEEFDLEINALFVNVGGSSSNCSTGGDGSSSGGGGSGGGCSRSIDDSSVNAGKSSGNVTGTVEHSGISKDKVVHKTERKYKKGQRQSSQAVEKEKTPLITKDKTIVTKQTDHATKVIKKKPIYIILHAALVRIGGITGRAISPIRIQAERILVEIEVKSGSITETHKLRIPFKELTEVQVNFSEPPFLLAVVINESYSKSSNLFSGGKKNGIFNKLEEYNKLYMVIQVNQTSISKEFKKDLDMLRQDLAPNLHWSEISSSQAEDIIKGEKVMKYPAEEKEVKDDKKDCVTQEICKKLDVAKDEDTLNKTKTTTTTNTQEESLASPAKSPRIETHVSAEAGNAWTNNTRVLESGRNVCRKRSYDGTTRSPLQTDGGDVEGKAEDSGGKVEDSGGKVEDSGGKVEDSGGKVEEDSGEKVENLEQTGTKSVGLFKSNVVSEKSLEIARQNERTQSFCFVHSQERSFEENRMQDKIISELERIISEKERLLNQRRVSVELKELQLKQEQTTVRELRESLKDEQDGRRGLETRFEVVNNELTSRNTRNRVERSRIDDMERELCQLNISLNTARSDNQRLAQEIREVRARITQNETTLETERNTIRTLQEDLGRERHTLEVLREDIQEKDNQIIHEQNLRNEAIERGNELEETLTSRTEQYEERLERFNEQHRTLQEDYANCNTTLERTQQELHNTSTALHRAQETIQEYSRMQPRDWTISRDEIQVSDVILGEGAWGWVKEGLFRGTKVAVKQMHELIVSPHNRRLFEREMQMAARCRHPNLLQFIGATNDNGLALLVSELLETNLRTILGQQSLCHDEVITLSRDVAKALNYLHMNTPFPIIHRDISSTNVLLWRREDTWRAKLSDYGAANFLRQCMTSSPGALIYAAPEAMTSQQSTKVDVYSFGLLLCEMCIRELPVPDHTSDQIRLITNPHLRDLVQRCTNRAPDNRPTMQSALLALDQLFSNTNLGSVSINNRHAVL